MRRLRTERSNVLTVSDLHVKVQTKEGASTLVQDINFELEKGRYWALLGKVGVVKPLRVCPFYSFLIGKQQQSKEALPFKDEN